MFAKTHWLKTRDRMSLRAMSWGDENASPCLICTGRNESVEKYEELAGGFVSRGYRVWAFDWRGQGRSDRETQRPQHGYIRRFESYFADLDCMLGQTGRAPLVFCHSMGAHVVLRYAAAHSDAFAAIIASAAMLEIDTGPVPEAAVGWLARRLRSWGLAESQLPGHRWQQKRGDRFEGNPLTRDRGRFDRTVELHSEHPEVITGGVTFGWLAAAAESMAKLRAPGVAESIDTPTLLVSAGADSVVRNRAHEQMAKRLPRAKHVTIESARHELPQGTDEELAALWASIDAFLTTGT